MSRHIAVLNLGRVSYTSALSVQKKIEMSILNESDAAMDTVILVEHDHPVYTVGTRSQAYSKDDEVRLRRCGADFVRTDRGGLITFHGPGQLVAYPVLNLDHFRRSVRWYVNTLEMTLTDTCLEFGVAASTCAVHTGVWVGNNKIAAIGIHVRNFVTSHGIALNCNVDLSWYKHIVACGIADRGVTSLSQETGRKVTVDEAVPIFLYVFAKHFNCKVVQSAQN